MPTAGRGVSPVFFGMRRQLVRTSMCHKSFRPVSCICTCDFFYFLFLVFYAVLVSTSMYQMSIIIQLKYLYPSLDGLKEPAGTREVQPAHIHLHTHTHTHTHTLVPIHGRGKIATCVCDCMYVTCIHIQSM